MLEMGNGGLTESQSWAHFSLWCKLAAPLMAGNDLSNMNAVTKNILKNNDTLTNDQDKLGQQGFKIKDYGEFEFFYKPLIILAD
jgi:alpha-galactosidase